MIKRRKDFKLLMNRSSGFDPISLNPLAWWKPSEIGTVYQTETTATPGVIGQPVGRVNDKSSNGRNLTEIGAARRGILTATAVQFDGVDDALTVATVFGSNIDVFMTVDSYNNDTAFILAYSNTGAFIGVAQSGNVGLPYGNSGTPTILVNGVVCATRDALYLALTPGPKVVEIRNANLQTNWTTFLLGNYPAFESNIRLGEVLVYNALSAADRLAVRTYLGG